MGWKRVGKTKFIDSKERMRGKINAQEIQGAQQDYFGFPKPRGRGSIIKKLTMESLILAQDER